MKNLQKVKQKIKERRCHRGRAKVRGTAERPRLCVSRSIKYLYAQLIDDERGLTLASASDVELGLTKHVGKRKRTISKAPPGTKERSAKEAVAYEVGKLIAKKAAGLGIKKVVFDRAGYKYHGRIEAAAKGAREGGLVF
jgi:large subunit ribosomal protein L18